MNKSNFFQQKDLIEYSTPLIPRRFTTSMMSADNKLSSDVGTQNQLVKTKSPIINN